MRSIIFSILFFGTGIILNAQIPNANFEDWQTMDSIENPAKWQTNNYYVGFTPVEKTTEAIEGDFSMKISSTARDVFGGATMPGCAHIKLLPAIDYKYMNASVKIDSIDEGEIAIRVKQRAQDGLFEKIGGWNRTTLTNGVLQIGFPIEQISMDTLLVEIWAFNKETILGNEGYSEAIIDNLQLTTTTAIHEGNNTENGMLTMYPNPAHGEINVRLNKMLPYQVHELIIKDIQGRTLKIINSPFKFETELKLSIDGYVPGVYVLELNTENKTFTGVKLVIH